MPDTAPPPGDMHLVLSPTVPDAEIATLQHWFATQGLQLTKLGVTSQGDIDCILLPASRPDPPTESGIPEIGPVWNARDVAQLIQERDAAVTQVRLMQIERYTDAILWLCERGNYDLMCEMRPDLISRLKKHLA